MDNVKQNTAFKVSNHEQRLKAIKYIASIYSGFNIDSYIKNLTILDNATYITMSNHNPAISWIRTPPYDFEKMYDIVDDIRVLDRMIWEQELKTAQETVDKIMQTEPSKLFVVPDEVKKLLSKLVYSLNQKANDCNDYVATKAYRDSVESLKKIVLDQLK